MFRDDFNTWNPDKWISGYWWMDARAPFHPDDRREWYNINNIFIRDGKLICSLRYDPARFDYLSYLYARLNETQNPAEQFKILQLIKKNKNEPIVNIDHSAGVVCSKDLYGYGFYEAVILNSGVGVWDAFWLYGEGDNPSEIDILERPSGSMSRYSTNIHVSFRCFIEKRKMYARDIHRDLSGWHRYGLEWTDKYIEFYFDGICVRRHRRKVPWITTPQRVIFNTAQYSGYPTELQVDQFTYESI